jgi:isocitrate dehydrogenase kinase/phosphatase
MNDQVKQQVVEEIIKGFDSYMASFKKLTRKVPEYFREKNWDGMQVTHKERLILYKDRVRNTVGSCHMILLEEIGNRNLWYELKKEYSLRTNGKKDKELAETFFNSTLRKTIPNFSIDEHLMFVHSDFNIFDIHPQEDLIFTYPFQGELENIFRSILDDFDFGVPYYEKEEDIHFLVEAIKQRMENRDHSAAKAIIQILKPVFYRNKAAYIIGRTNIGNERWPFIIPFLHSPKGVFVDTIIFDPDIISGIFSFTRSYFMADIAIPAQIINFLSSIIPQKKIHELYNAIGFNKHGKTVFYRDFLDHLHSSNDQFIAAPGIKGMVMTVFTLPSYNIVFKLIKDHFDPPKNMTRQQVKAKYKLVSQHDRVGRMADTHEFENFHLPLDRISPSLMKELRNTVNSLLETRGQTLIIKHMYTERRMIPLNIYLESCHTHEAMRAVEEYGSAILQLAKANIFPGDMMTKNFGVTRQKRVIFYDYDEIEFLVDMNFRKKPKAETFDQIYASEPWYDIAPNDVFPEDFKRFMIGRADVKEHFFNFHKNIFDPIYWIEIQKRINRGELIHAFPYPREIRFRHLEKF